MGFLDRLRRRPPGVTATVHLNARLQPMHRGDWYEDPLQAAFTASGEGHQVTGGGTLMGADGRIDSCDLELQLADGDLDRTIGQVVRFLDDAGAPRGSWLQVGDGERVPLGSNEGLAVVLPVETPVDALYDDVPGNEAVMELMKRLADALGDDGAVQSWWTRDDGSVIYLYGPSAARMRDVVGPVLAQDPLARGHEVQVIA